MQELKRIGIASLAKFQAVIMAIYALVFGLPWLLIGSAADAGFGFAVYLAMVIGGLVFGAIGGAITAGVYNLIAGSVGGVEVKIAG